MDHEEGLGHHALAGDSVNIIGDISMTNDYWRKVTHISATLATAALLNAQLGCRHEDGVPSSAHSISGVWNGNLQIKNDPQRCLDEPIVLEFKGGGSYTMSIENRTSIPMTNTGSGHNVTPKPVPASRVSGSYSINGSEVTLSPTSLANAFIDGIRRLKISTDGRKLGAEDQLVIPAEHQDVFISRAAPDVKDLAEFSVDQAIVFVRQQ